MVKSKKTILGVILCTLMALCLTLGVFGLTQKPEKAFANDTQSVSINLNRASKLDIDGELSNPESIGLNDNWSFSGDKGGYMNSPYIEDGVLWLKGTSSKKNSVTVTAPAGQKILSLELSCVSIYSGVAVFVNDEEVTGEGDSQEMLYTFDDGCNSFTVARGSSVVGIMSFKINYLSEQPPQRNLLSIEIQGTPTKTEYKAGETFDTAGLKVMGSYDQGEPTEITNGITWSFNPETISVGTTQVVVTAKVEDFTSQEFTVNGLKVTALVPTTGEVGYLFATDENFTVLPDGAAPCWFRVISSEPKEVAVVTYNKADTGDVVIPSTVSDGINTYAITQIGITGEGVVFVGNITSLTFPEGVRVIDEYATCFTTSSLTSITFPSTLQEIKGSAFMGDFSIQSLTFNGTQPPIISSDSFDYNYGSVKIYVPAASVEAYQTATNWSAYANNIEAIPAPAETKTVAEILPDNFTYGGQNSWMNKDQKRIFLNDENDGLSFTALGSLVSHFINKEVTKVSDDIYEYVFTYNDDEIKLEFLIQIGDEKFSSINVSGFTGDYEKYNGIYKFTVIYKTIREIIANNPDLPATYANGWVNEHGTRMYFTDTKIIYTLSENHPYPQEVDVNQAVIRVSDTQYKYDQSLTYYLFEFNLDDNGKLISVKLINNATTNDFVGTYKAPVPVTTYTVTIDVAANGSVDTEELTNVAEGTTYTVDGNKLTVGETEITATPNEGYEFDYWTVDGQSVTSGTITEDTTFEAVFKKEEMTIEKVLATNPDFPKKDSDAWKSENGGICYLSNGTHLLVSNMFSQIIDITSPVIADGDNFSYVVTGWGLTFNMEGGKLVSITGISFVNQYDYLKGTYKIVVKYDITNGTTVDDKSTNNGYIEINKALEEAGKTITVTVCPNDGYVLKSLSYVGIQKKTIWQNVSGAPEIGWSSTYQFANSTIATEQTLAILSDADWNVIKTGTFYLKFAGSNGFSIKVYDSWWGAQWHDEEICAGSELITDNNDGTYILELNFAGYTAFLGDMEAKGLLFTGNGYTPLEIYYYGTGTQEITKDAVSSNYQFTMPAFAVTVTATFEEKALTVVDILNTVEDFPNFNMPLSDNVWVNANCDTSKLYKNLKNGLTFGGISQFDDFENILDASVTQVDNGYKFTSGSYTITFVMASDKLVQITLEGSQYADNNGDYFPPHVHGNWEITGSGNTLTASCGNDGCTDTPYSVTLTLIAPEDLVYNGLSKEVTIADDEATAWKTIGLELPTIVYTKLNGEFYVVYSGTPTEVGSYFAHIYYGDGGANAFVRFNITQAEVTKPIEDTTNYIYTGSPITYNVAENDLYTISGNVQTNAGNYTVTVSLKDKDNYEWVGGTTTDLEFTFVIKQAKIVNPVDENDKEIDEPSVMIIDSEKGLDPNSVFVVKVISSENVEDTEKVKVVLNENSAVGKNEKIYGIYDAKLLVGGVEKQPDGNITIKILVPKEIRNKAFKLYHIHNGSEVIEVEYTEVDSDGFITFVTDKLSQFAFVAEKTATKLSAGAIIGIIIGALIVLLIILYFVMYFIWKKTGKAIKFLIPSYEKLNGKPKN